MARLDARGVEDLVDQREHVPASRHDVVRAVALRLLRQRPLQDSPEAEDGVQRRAQFVAHAREKLALGVVGALGLVLGLLERGVGTLAAGYLRTQRVVDPRQLGGAQADVVVQGLPEALEESVLAGQRALRLLAGVDLRAQPAGETTQVQLVHHHRRQVGERAFIFPGELARGRVHHAQRPQRLPLGGAQRGTGIEAHIALPGSRTAAERPVHARVPDDQHALLQDGAGAKRQVPAHLAPRQAVARLVPHPVFVHERDGRHRHGEEPRCRPHDSLEGGFGRGVQDLVATQFEQTPGFVPGEGKSHGTTQVWGWLPAGEADSTPGGFTPSTASRASEAVPRRIRRALPS